MNVAGVILDRRNGDTYRSNIAVHINEEDYKHTLLG